MAGPFERWALVGRVVFSGQCHVSASQRRGAQEGRQRGDCFAVKCLNCRFM